MTPEHSPAIDDAAIIGATVMWNRLISVCEEQANALLRVAFGAVVREAGDLSAGVFDAKGQMMAQAVTGTPGHVNTMARSVGAMLRHVPADTLREGDVLITNDPWLGAGHIFDFVVVTPVFHGGALVGFMASTCHIVDVGGIGWSAEARSVFEEGVLIPVMHLRAGGRLNENLLRIVAANSRVPHEARGDIISLMTCNDEGARRLQALMAEYALPELELLAKFIFERSAQAAEAAIRALPEGRFVSTTELDGYDSPIRLCADMVIKDGRIRVSLAGSSPAIEKGINCPLTYTQAYASFGVRAAVAPHVPNNAASLGLVEIEAPSGLIVSAEWPSPVTARHVVGQALPDLMLGCLAQAIPGKVLAESAGALWVLAISGSGTRPFASLNVALGGMGARPDADGLSTTAFPSGVGSVPIEVAETVAPLVFRSKEFAPGSGGAGQYRGGLGQEIEVASAEEGRTMHLSAAAFERLTTGAAGRDGGADGAPGRAEIRFSDGTAEPISTKGHYIIPPGASLWVRTPGGGGFGPNAERDPDAHARDVRHGLLATEPDKTTPKRLTGG